jgi:hypothetical protein
VRPILGRLIDEEAEVPEVVVLVPQELLLAIEQMAERDERSRPAQIRYLLRQAVARSEREVSEQASSEEASCA